MRNENTVSVKAVRTFEGEEGFKTPASAPFDVSRQRFADLRANGLVTEVSAAAPELKAAPKPSNKAAAKHENK